jgi:hypothetical protein
MYESKVKHGQYTCTRIIDKQLISEEDISLRVWLLRGDLKTETDSEIIASHDQVLQMK